jgi:hypothetical protein
VHADVREPAPNDASIDRRTGGASGPPEPVCRACTARFPAAHCNANTAAWCGVAVAAR